MLIFDGVLKSFGEHRVLAGCTFSIPEGTIWGLVGPNGAGKTTTLRLAAGLDRPSAGTIRVGGRDPQCSSREVRALIGFCPDVPFAYEFLTGREFLRFVAGLWGLRGSVTDERCAALLHQFRLGPVADRLVREYSRGMRQKLGLAAAVLHGPRLLLLDEPFTNVDAESETVLHQWLSDFASRGGTVVFATHRMDLVSQLAERCLELHDGQVRELPRSAWTGLLDSRGARMG